MFPLFLPTPWPLIVLAAAASLWASGHALLTKRNVRAASGWCVIIWLLPFLGAGLYLIFGINRIRRKALRLRRRRRQVRVMRSRPDMPQAPPIEGSLLGLFRVATDITGHAVAPGNRFAATQDGDETYSGMLAAIQGAKETIGLTSYIFCNDEIGRVFVDALADAKARGVEVRVLVDGVGMYYSYPTILSPLAAAGIPAASFLPAWVPGRWVQMNLRNHRKILVVDGRIGFCGGTNIHDPNLTRTPDATRIRDMHFRIEGPVAAQITEAFVEDWAFATGEVLDGPGWFPTRIDIAGEAWARGISHGPDAEPGPLQPIILTAINQAQRCVRIVNPYFLPDETLIAALVLAAKRGVVVEIVTPQIKGWWRPLDWAAMAQLDLLIAGGCAVYASGLPFDHAKLMTIDGCWSLVGSSNLDPRSLRLNFEFNLEVYDSAVAAEIDGAIDARRDKARLLSLEEVEAVPTWARLRNRFVWLFQPYL
jgi:cardiolipin synthase